MVDQTGDEPMWPLDGFEVRTPQLTLRYVDDILAREVVTLAARGIHAPDYMPFSVPWSTAPSPQLERGALAYHWRNRAEMSPERWTIAFAVIVDGVVVGSTDVAATHFPLRRVVTTGSWLGRAHQGKGFGKEFRRACLAFAFDGLGAERAETSAWFDNGPSIGVTRSLGYTENGDAIVLGGIEMNQARRQLRFKMERDHFATIPSDDITFHGLERVRQFLAVDDAR